MEIVWIVGVVVALVVVVLILRAALRGMRPQAPEPQSYVAPAVSPRTAPTSAEASTASRLTPQAAAEIDQLLAANQKITAIKVYREHTGVGLKEAKDAVDHWAVTSTTRQAPISHAAPPHAPTGRAALPSAVAAEIDRLVAANQKITAIKIYRDHTGLGLKESKDAIEAWRPQAGR